jgi:hypothetical protein
MNGSFGIEADFESFMSAKLTPSGLEKQLYRDPGGKSFPLLLLTKVQNKDTYKCRIPVDKTIATL